MIARIPGTRRTGAARTPHHALFAGFVTLAFAPGAIAAITVSAPGFSYSQNFDALANSGSANAWTNDVTLPGWSLFRQPAPGTALTAYATDNSAGTTAGSFYSYGSAGGNERALGGTGSGGAYYSAPGSGAVAGWIAVSLQNNTGAALSSFTVAFDGEQWRNGGNTNAQTMVMQYGFGSSFGAVVTWFTPGGNFDWSSPVTGGTAAAVDGNNAGKVTARGGTVAGVTWNPGDTLWIRWVENNDTGNDHGLAIDNFSFSIPGGGPVNGACSSANGQSFTSVPTNLCAAGTASAVSGSGPWNWTCAGLNGGSTASCSANLDTTPVNGSCGSANGQSLTAAPTANLCATGTATTVTGSGPWNWSCSGANGGSTSACAASLNTSGLTAIYTIQGPGNTSPLVGQAVTTSGIVTKVNNNGFYLQDPVGDGDPLTSDGVFVFTSTTPAVTAGQSVRLTGTVSEFNTGAAGNAITLAHTVTELTTISGLTVLGTGGAITPTPVTLPLAAADDMERYEGMLVTISTPLTASQNYFQGRYGQVTLSAGGRLFKPTNLYAAGSPNALALQNLNARNSIMLDDGTSTQNPNPTPYIGADNTLRAGDTLPTGITGVIDYGLTTSFTDGLAMYRIHPTITPVFTRSNARTAAPPAVGGNIKVASFNVLNFFTTFTNGQTADGLSGQGCSLGASVAAANCRGADDLNEFNRQRAKIVQAMAAINADVFGLMEIQNNGNTAAQNLVDALNAVPGAGPYAVASIPPTTGTDAIRVAMIYKPATLTQVGASMSDGSAIHNRPPYAATFRAANNEKFSVIVNHFKSKSCDGAAGIDADQGDGQGCYNDRRKQQANALLSFINTVQATAADNDVMVIGDLNAYGAEDPINILTGAGLVNQISRFGGTTGYSYVFDGEAGYLDHALATASLSAQINTATHWHINADEPSIIDYNIEFKQPDCGTCGPDYYTATPYRASDHDPVLIGVNLLPPLLSQTITFTAPADRAVDAGPFTAVATASSGLAVSFASTTPAVCSTTAPGNVTLLAVGTCTLTADQPGNASYAPAAQVARSFNVTAALLTQTISFAPIADRAVNSGAFSVTATASSGLTVTIASQTPGVCTVTAGTVTLLAVGSCTLNANQSGNGVFAPAPTVAQSFAVTSGGAAVPIPHWALLLLAAGLLGTGMLTMQRRQQR
jgi:predicted extracellular nuclease